MKPKKFVGFGFGPIQSGLMLYEAIASGSFDSYVVAEVDQGLVERVRRNGDSVAINIARSGGIDRAVLADIRILNPLVPDERDEIARAVSVADEIATAVPSVNLYTAGGQGSVASLVAHNVNPEKEQIIYAAENNNFAAQILKDSLLGLVDREKLAGLQILNTVIGKMSGVIQDRGEMEELELAPMTPDSDRAVLVEEFNRIMVSRCRLTDGERGIPVFEEKEDLLPYEEAKLYGHNAIHAVLGYLGWRRGYRVMSGIRGDKRLMSLGRDAFLLECGAALLKKYADVVHDSLFTEPGWAAYVDDLLQRMTNPYLHDKVARICRDPTRKLGYNDRIFGSMRLALEHGLQPRRLARGALAGLQYLVHHARQKSDAVVKEELSVKLIRTNLEALWAGENEDDYREQCLNLVAAAAGEEGQ